MRTLRSVSLGALVWIAIGCSAAFASPDGHENAEHAGGHGEAQGEHGEAHGGEHHGLAAPAPINFAKFDKKLAPPFALALFNFVVFASLLLWKAGPPIRQFVAARHNQIKEALDESARLRDDARRKLEEYNRKIAGVDSVIDKLVGEIRAEAEGERKRIQDEARRQADEVKRSADAQVESMIARARQEIEIEVVARAVDAAGKLIAARATPADQEKLVASFINDLVPHKRRKPGDTGGIDEEWS